MKRLLQLAMVAVLVGLGGAGHAAGVVEVTFVDPDRYADIGRSHVDRRNALESLERHFKALGAKLPGDQRLKIEVLDVDLAGEIQMTPRFGDGETRVLRGSTDGPHMTLKYTLTSAGETIKSGQDRLSDMSYLDRRARPPTATAQAYYYETRMVDRWFAQTFMSTEPVQPK